ncbi:MAG TPA: TlpA disulfide reductase family protein [Burkholderiales bacterium]|nr:TlpA disulfide reductase family protein [Burkholderiales bacterium]
MTIRRRDALILGGVGIAAALAGAIFGPRLLRSEAPLAVLDGASFVDLDGRARHIAEWKGRPLVCNFWATWCPPCRQEIPLLDASHEKIVSKGGEILGIALDSATNVAEFTKSVRISYPIVISDPSAIGLLAQLGNPTGGLPYTLFIDRAGSLVGHKLGMLHVPDLEANLVKLFEG